GPVAAVEVCQLQAPTIAAEAGQRHGVTVQRVTDRPRNSANAADPWQRARLSEFADALEAGADPKLIDALDAQGQGDAIAWRYMKPIVIEPVCLTCHGPALAPDLAQTLDRLYPQDAARGYAVGDLRGAFFVEWLQPRE
ncbi:MAG: DUF3365 domain-containing protein, partial [Pseudomonadota bacterium]